MRSDRRRCTWVNWVAGIVVPGVLLLLAAVSASTGRAYLPDRGMGLAVVTDRLAVVGLAIAKTGVAVVMHAWLFLAARERCAAWVRPLLVVGALAIMLGKALLLRGVLAGGA